MVRPREHTREEFIDVAFRLVDAEGIEALTARRLGKEMGVSATAVYTYFETRDALVSALVGYLSGQIVERIVVSGDSPREQIMAMALSARRVISQHPRLAAVFLVSNSDVGEGQESTRAVLSVLESAGLTGVRLVTTFRVIESYILGATIFDHGAAPQHLSIRRDRYRGVGHPELKAVAKSEATIKRHNDQSFEAGLLALLDGLGIQ